MRRWRTPPAPEIVTIRPTGLAPRPAERSPRPVPLRTGCRSGLLGVSRGPDDLSRRDQREPRPERRVARKNAGRHAARLERRCEILRLGRRAGMDRPSATEAPVPALIAPDCSQEIGLAERGPLDITEIELTMGTLPQHEAGESHLPGGPDNYVRIGAVVRVAVLVHRPRGPGLENLVGSIAPTQAVARCPFHRVRDLLPSSVPRRDIQESPLVMARRGLCGSERFKG